MSGPPCVRVNDSLNSPVRSNRIISRCRLQNLGMDQPQCFARKSPSTKHASDGADSNACCSASNLSAPGKPPNGNVPFETQSATGVLLAAVIICCRCCLVLRKYLVPCSRTLRPCTSGMLQNLTPRQMQLVSLICLLSSNCRLCSR